jgi:hypothetical protein
MEAEIGPYPERPGEPDCVRIGLCGSGMSCGFNHPPNWKQVFLHLCLFCYIPNLNLTSAIS